MSNVVEEIREEGRIEGREEGRIETAKKLLRRGKDSFEEIADLTELSLEEVKEIFQGISA